MPKIKYTEENIAMWQKLKLFVNEGFDSAQHSLFGCDRDIYIGAAMEGELCRCSQCGQVWLRNFEGRHDIKPRRLSNSEADRLLVSVLR